MAANGEGKRTGFSGELTTKEESCSWRVRSDGGRIFIQGRPPRMSCHITANAPALVPRPKLFRAVLEWYVTRRVLAIGERAPFIKRVQVAKLSCP